MPARNKLIVNFSQVDKEDVGLVGGKGANLGEMTQAGFPVPAGFIITSQAYFKFLEKDNLSDTINTVLKTVNVDHPDELNEASRKIKKLILEQDFPSDLAQLIITSYFRLGGEFKSILVAVRSSATAEDLPTASFAGQQETFLNVSGESNLIPKVQACWASLFTPRAIYYREKNNFSHFKVGIAVVVQKMVESEASGVMFTLDPINNDKNKIIVEAILGLGELIVQGAVTPDHFEFNKKTLELSKKIVGFQDKILLRSKNGNKLSKISTHKASSQKISDKIVKEIAILGKKIERHYYFSQDIEWAVEKNKIYIVQTRPVTTVRKIEDRKWKIETERKSTINLPIILTGQPASPGIASGPAKIIYSAKELNKIKPGDILVTKMTNPDFVPAMKKARAIVTDEGGRTAHAAIVSRELGIPCVVGSQKATQVLKNNQIYTVDGGKGEVYKGGLEIRQISSLRPDLWKGRVLSSPLKTATKVYCNLAEPDNAQEVAQKNVDGVGLLRAEFMIAQIGTHPKEFLKEHKGHLFTNELCQGIKTICEAFYPRPVVYRATDFKTNEYRNLKGGKFFEPEESNPMLGFRGAYRYIKNPDVFKLEIEAIKLVRNKYGLKNLWLMIPFVRTVKEFIEIRSLLSLHGLRRSSSFKLWLMVEIPSNVILLSKFIEAGIDGISLGTNDLTMLILGTDRDNSEVASEYDERNEAVLWAIEQTIKTCQKHKITSSICGQAPSDYPDLTEKLVEWGITSVSVNPDFIEQAREIIYEAEKRKLLT